MLRRLAAGVAGAARGMTASRWHPAGPRPFATAVLESAAVAVRSATGSSSRRPRIAGHLTRLLPLLLAGGVAVHVARADDGEMVLFSGNANLELAAEIATLLGVGLGDITVARFADGEVNVQVHDNVRGKDVYIIQPTCAPVNEHLMELLLMVSTMRRASAERITCVIPYYGYARQDRKMTARVPISAADVARLLEAMGVDRVIAVDLHCGQIQVRGWAWAPVALAGLACHGSRFSPPCRLSSPNPLFPRPAHPVSRRASLGRACLWTTSPPAWSASSTSPARVS